MRPISITESEIFEAIRASVPVIAERRDDVSTVRELALAWGMSITTVQRRIQPLLKSGQMEYVRVVGVDVLGRPQQVPAYRLVKKAIAPIKCRDTGVNGAKPKKVARKKRVRR